MTAIRGPEDWNELRFCQVIGGMWRVPSPGGWATDLARAAGAARPCPGRLLPAALAAALAGMPALVRPGAAILLADAARAEAALYAMSHWLHDCHQAGQDPACLSLLQPVIEPTGLPVAVTGQGWQLIPLFSAARL